jgi:hypothetical protein
VRSQGPSIWEQLPCPNLDCGHVYTHQQVHCLADAGTFALYDEYGLNRILEKRPSFRKCLRPGCSNGQMYQILGGGESSTSNRVECGACGFAMCFKHQCPWHENSLCDEYDLSSRRRQSVQLMQLWLAKSTKACPGPRCGVRIEKNQGCFHMTCRSCRFEFCWECLGDWGKIKVDRNAHKENCFFRDPSAPSAMAVLGNTVEEARRSVL